jgi:hypothetical protein
MRKLILSLAALAAFGLAMPFAAPANADPVVVIHHRDHHHGMMMFHHHHHMHGKTVIIKH